MSTSTHLHCVVLGAGLMGRLLAWQLARAGHQVTVFEAGDADSLGIAVRFIGFVAAMLVVAHYAQEFAGDIGLMLSGLLAGAIDVDAATVSASRLASTTTSPLSAAATTIALAVLANSLVKSGIAFRLGPPTLGWPTTTILLASAAITVTTALALG